MREAAKSGTSGGSAAAIALLLAAIFVPSHFSRDPWNPDEPRYVEVAREMKLARSYVLPRLNGEIYAEKPPLYFWLVNGAERAIGLLGGARGGSFALAGRAVSALATALGALFLGL